MEFSIALATLRDIASMCPGDRVSDSGIEAASIVLEIYKTLSRCAVCGEHSIPPSIPPHCRDCYLDEEHEEAWKKRIHEVWVKP